VLRSQERLGQVEKLKNDFIEKMSRELRTPLNGIIESIIAVLAGENDVLSETAQQSLRHALDDGTAFLRTLQNILDLWRIKQGEMPVEVQDVNFREVVEEAIFSVQDTIGSNPVTIEKLRRALPKIRTDLAKVSQILFLLLDNAVKFTPQGRIEIAAQVQDSALHCEVRDTGIGICPDEQFIFDEFYRSTNWPRRNTGARGSASRWCAICCGCSTAGSHCRARSEAARHSRSACPCRPSASGRAPLRAGLLRFFFRIVGLDEAGRDLAQCRDDFLVLAGRDHRVRATLDLLGADRSHLHEMEAIRNALDAVLDRNACHRCVASLPGFETWRIRDPA
jgi:hypothetical protein